MAIEIERKFLVKDDRWRQLASVGERFQQGYLPTETRCSVRVRVCGGHAWLNIKTALGGLMKRAEFEYPIPLEDASYLLEKVCRRPLIEKTRHEVAYQGRCWEIDVFEGDNLGLVVAEVELEDEDAPLPLPEWVGQEVTEDPRYLNQNLVSCPFNSWA
ncbi:MAG: CYTH domain-containing protein [Gammaproteobacteria bacterium]|nr:CYTH domain-containing protein [Gammaproteobacteria bacterium]